MAVTKCLHQRLTGACSGHANLYQCTPYFSLLIVHINKLYSNFLFVVFNLFKVIQICRKVTEKSTLQDYVLVTDAQKMRKGHLTHLGSVSAYGPVTS